MTQNYINNNPFGSPLDGLNYTVTSGTCYSNIMTGIGTSNFSFMAPLLSDSTNNNLTLTGNADIVIDGVSLKKFMETMQDRLVILQPDPTKLEKFEALRLAYENYKLLENLLHDN